MVRFLFNVMMLAYGATFFGCSVKKGVPEGLLDLITEHVLQQVYDGRSSASDGIQEMVFFSEKMKSYYLVEFLAFDTGKGKDIIRTYRFDPKNGNLALDAEAKVIGNRLIVGGEYAKTVKTWSTVRSIR